MKENDIAVELYAFSSSSSKLARHASDIEQLANQLRYNLAYVSGEFDTVNFQRADETVQSVMEKLHVATEHLQRCRGYLNGLGEKADRYLRCKYN